MQAIPIEDKRLSELYDKRYIVIDKETGEILDTAQSYGYKSPQKAMAAWAYKTRDTSRDNEKRLKKKQIKLWMMEHKEFVALMNTFAFEIYKGSWEPKAKFNAKFVKQMLKDSGLETDFTASELLKVWKEH